MDASFVNIAIVVVYLVAMLAFGWWGKSRTKNNSDFLVAGRRLGPFLYTGTMAAVVLGGASTVGGVGLGYKFGISGHVARGRDRRRRAAAQPALRQHHPEAEDLHRLPDAEPALRQPGHADLGHRHARLHPDALRHVHRAPTPPSSWSSSAGTARWPSPSAAPSCWSTRPSAACGRSRWPTRSSSSSRPSASSS